MAVPNEFIFKDLWNKLSPFASISLDETEWCNALQSLGFDAVKEEMVQLFQDILNRAGYQDDVYIDSDIFAQSFEKMDTKYLNKFKKLYYQLFSSIDRDHIKTKSFCCHQWRLPRFKVSEVQLICCGFVRNEFNKFIPFDIIKICIQYFCSDLQPLLDEIAEISDETGKNWRSGIFDYKSYKFCIEWNVAIEGDKLGFWWFIEYV